MPLDDKVLPQHEVRLFPSVRISSGREAEQRATAALLAIAKAVSEFGRVLVSMADGPRGHLQCYTEVPFVEDVGGERHELRPDGLIHVTRGRREWKALVEVKVGDNPLDQDQFDQYHKLAKREGMDAMITVSNQAALANGLPPLSVDGRRMRSVPVSHISWERLLSEARVLSRKAVEDPDQQWMLEEWVHYLADPASQIIAPPQLGEHWNKVLQAAREGNLQGVSKQLLDVVMRWNAFQKKAAMRLRAKLGVDVRTRMSRSDRANPDARVKRLHADALRDKALMATFQIPDAVGDVSVRVLLPGRSVQYGVAVKAPTEGRLKTRINWLLRQLRSAEAPDDLMIKVQWDKSRAWSQARLGKAVSDARVLLYDTDGAPIDRTATPRSFLLESTSALARGRGRSTIPVLESISDGLEAFYKAVVERLRPFVPSAPRLTDDGSEPARDQGASEAPTPIERTRDTERPTVQDSGTDEGFLPVRGDVGDEESDAS